MDKIFAGVSQANVDVGVFHEIKLTEVIYMRIWAGYRVVATPKPSQKQGGVAIVYQDSPVITFKEIHQFGANVIMLQLEMGKRR